MNFSLTNGDAIFPWYIVKELPNGVVGLLISGILAAACRVLAVLIPLQPPTVRIFILDFGIQEKIKPCQIGNIINRYYWNIICFVHG